MRLLKASRGRSFLHNHKQLGEGSVNGRLQDGVGNAGADLGPSETVVLANVQEKGRRKSGALALVVGKARVSTRPLPRPVASPVSGFSGWSGKWKSCRVRNLRPEERRSRTRCMRWLRTRWQCSRCRGRALCGEAVSLGRLGG